MVFFQDGARFGRISRETPCRLKKDMVPSIAKQLIREYIYGYSALSPQTGDCFSIISPVCNTEAMNVFLNLMSQEYRDYRMVILLDKAGWHTCSMLEHFLPT